MARIHFNKEPSTPKSVHLMTLKEARYVTKARKHTILSVILGSIAIVEFILLLHRGL
jgi:hypothetical protein